MKLAGMWASLRPMAIFLVTIAALCSALPARAGDIESAKKFLEKAKEDLKGQDWNSIEDDLKNADEFLDGVPDAEKAPVAKELAAVRAQSAAGLKAFKSAGIIKDVTREIDSATSDAVAAPDSALGAVKRANEMLASDDAKKYLDPAQAKKLQDRLAGIQAMAFKKVKAAKLAFIAPPLKELQDAIASDPFKGKDQQQAYQLGQQLNSLASRVRGGLDDLPKDDPDVRAVYAKVDAIAKQIDAQADAGEKMQAIAALADQWKNTQGYFAGWEQEPAGPTWEKYTHESSNEMSQLLMPKTVDAITRIKYWLGDTHVKEVQARYAGDPALKTTIDDANSKLDATAGKLSKAFNALLDEAEKLPQAPADASMREKPQTLASNAATWFGGTKYAEPNAARATKLYQKWRGAVEGVAEAKEALFNKMTEQATAAWPAIAAAVPTTDGFTPDKADQFKGKTIKLKGSNRVGWDYTAESYDFAYTINGMVVAGKYDPTVRAAVNSIRSRTGKDLPEDYDVVAVVEGPGKIKERVTSEGKVTVDGQQVGTISSEGNRSLDCTVVKIIAMHAGPVAVGPNGAVSETGAVVTPAALASGGGATPAAAAATGAAVSTVTWIVMILIRLIWLAFALAAAALVYLKAKPQALAQVSSASPGAGSATTSINSVLTPSLVGIVGLALAGLGLIWLLSTLIIYDLLPALALLTAGIYLASDFLLAKGIMPAGLYQKMKPLGIPIAAAVAILALIHLFAGGLPLL